ncbi:MAG: hypothetical protein KZQ73_04565 [Candidatus Thiodiazotropha sp. (ex Semelilucina semeliformis)]|nr:hypothetical protein [Candidatus Thiodiazotropha sp. (ex Semelilucina semeliformis)]
MSENQEVKEQACELAKSLLASDSGYLDKVIELWKIGNSLYGQCWDTEFHVFGAIESETDHLPTSKVREHSSVAMLKRTDKEIADVVAFYKEQVTEACNEILATHQNV